MGRHRPLAGVVLAAGDGTRMRSDVPKVLHPVCGRPILAHAVGALAELPLRSIVVVVGQAAETVTKTLQEQVAAPVEFVEQRAQRGTGDAVSVSLTASAFDGLDDEEDDVIVLPGDHPLLTGSTLAALVAHHRETGAAATMLTARFEDPTGYGRVVRAESGAVDRVVEQTDATEEQLAISEINTSIFCFRRALLAPALRRLSPTNAQGEYYLTDVIEVLRSAGHQVEALLAPDPRETVGVNDRLQLAQAETEMRTRINEAWMRAGVSMVDPARTYIDADVAIEPDACILPGASLVGRTVVGCRSVIGPDTRLVDARVGDDTTIEHSVVRESEVGDRCSVGPFAHVRPGVRIADDVRVGNFVEIKNANIEAGAKVPHLSYIGDADVGERANIGAGTITANYDGKDKHRTVVGPEVKTGSNSVLVAPVTVGRGATLGAGAVVTSDVPPGAVAKGVPARWEQDDAREDRDE